MRRLLPLLLLPLLAGCATSSAFRAGEKAERLQDYDRAVLEALVATGVQPGFEVGKELHVYKLRQFLAGHSFLVHRPVAPAQMIGQRRLVIVFHQFEFGFAVVEYF